MNTHNNLRKPDQYGASGSQTLVPSTWGLHLFGDSSKGEKDHRKSLASCETSTETNENRQGIHNETKTENSKGN